MVFGRFERRRRFWRPFRPRCVCLGVGPGASLTLSPGWSVLARWAKGGAMGLGARSRSGVRGALAIDPVEPHLQLPIFVAEGTVRDLV
jgi:hypothetical protein